MDRSTHSGVVAAPPRALCHGAPGSASVPCRPDFLGLQDHDRGMREKGVPVGAPIPLLAYRRDPHGMPDDLAKTRLVQDGLIRGLRPIIVADIHRATAGEHRHIERGPVVQGTGDRHAGVVVVEAGQLVDRQMWIDGEGHETPPGVSC